MKKDKVIQNLILDVVYISIFMLARWLFGFEVAVLSGLAMIAAILTIISGDKLS